MALKTFNPTSPGRRQLVLVDRSGLHKGAPVKALTEGKHSSGGRNNLGRRTSRWRGGGAKKRYRIIDFKRLKYTDGELAYIIAPQRVDVGDTVVAGESVDIKPGNALPLKSIPVGTIIHNIEMKPLKGAQIARSAGSYAQLVGRGDGYAQVKLSSGEVRLIPELCMASIGAVSNPDNMNEVLGKAGRNVNKGWRPHVRGVAMNPVDHPHGGGEGKTSGGRHPVTPWGKKTRGPKTRKNKSTDRLIVRRRHKA
jgi:large subunit ribosomal protein L2